MHSALRLSLSFALAWGQFYFIAAFAGILGVRLGGDLAWAGIPFLLVYLGTALAGMPAGRLIDEYGYRRVLMGGHFITAAGTITSAYGLAADSLWVFLCGVGVAALGIGTTNLTRLAAGDLFPAAQRARGMAFVVGGAVGGVAAAALLSALLFSTMTKVNVTLLWALGCLLPSLAIILLLGLHPDPRFSQLRLPVFAPRVEEKGRAAASTALVATHAAMGTLMAVAGATMVSEGRSLLHVSIATGAHLGAMFLLAVAWGASGDRWGTTWTLRVATGLLLLSCLALAVPPLAPTFVVWLTLVGLAWSGALVAASAAIVDATRPHERGAVLGIVDVIAALVAAGGSIGAGLLLGRFGLVGVAVLSAAFAAVAALGAWRAPATRPLRL